MHQRHKISELSFNHVEYECFIKISNSGRIKGIEYQNFLQPGEDEEYHNESFYVHLKRKKLGIFFNHGEDEYSTRKKR